MCRDRGFLSCITRWKEDGWLCFFLVFFSCFNSLVRAHLFLWANQCRRRLSPPLGTDSATCEYNIWPRQIEADFFSREASGGLINSFNQLRMQQLRSCRNGPSLTLRGARSIYHTAPVSIRKKRHRKRYLMNSFQHGGTMKNRHGSKFFYALIFKLRLLLLRMRAFSCAGILGHGTSGLFISSQRGKRGEHCRFWAVAPSKSPVCRTDESCSTTLTSNGRTRYWRDRYWHCGGF